MKRTISFIVVLAMIFSFAIAVVPASAAGYYAITTSTDDPGATYGAGPSVRFWANSYYAQSFEAYDDIVGVSFGCWEAGSGANIDLSFYAYNTDVATSIAGTAALTTTIAATQGQDANSIIMLPSTLPAGKYVVKFASATDQGVHMAQGPKATGAEISTYEVTGLDSGNAILMGIYTEMPTDMPITSATQIGEGETVLTQDISGQLSVSSGTYVIDLAGHTWRHNNVPLHVMGTADVTIIDSVGGGMIDSYLNDGPYVYDGAKLTLDGVKVSADGSGMDALFVKGGTLIVKNSTLVASKACINLSEYVTSQPTVIVENTTFEVYNGSENKERICAFEFRNSLTTVKLVGDNKFENSTVLLRDVADGKTPSNVASLFTYGDSASATFSAAGALIQSRWTPHTINYTYTAPVETKLGASIEITNGIALDFVVSNAPANAVVMIDDVEFDVSYVDGQDSHYILDGFGPHTMGDEHTAELYVDGELLATKTYSVKKYCSAVIDSTEASDAHKTLAKAILNYGAKAQVYADYNVENLVYTGNEFDNSYDPAEDVALILNDFADASANWVNANVKFGDTLELIINLEGEADNVDVTIGTESTTYEVLTTAAGTKYIVVTEITPDQFRDSIAAVAYNGDVRVSKTLTYSVGSYISDRVQNSTNQAYKNLVMALSIYGDAVAAFVA